MKYFEHIAPYTVVDYIHDYRGYAVWRVGTGCTVEVLQLFASEYRQGYGTSMLADMCSKLMDAETVTVFGFTRAQSVKAQAFYISLGFKLIRIPAMYAEGDAVLFTQKLTTLKDKLHAH